MDKKEILHITHTGFYAGKTYCGKPIQQNERGAHYGQWVKNPNINLCKACKYLLPTLGE